MSTLESESSRLADEDDYANRNKENQVQSNGAMWAECTIALKLRKKVIIKEKPESALKLRVKILLVLASA